MQTSALQPEMNQASGGFVVGHGVDVVDLDEFSHLMREPVREFLDRHFTTGELAAAGEGRTRGERLAARLAIKEAVMKALGTGWGDGVAFTDVEVVVSAVGAPNVVLHRRLAELQREKSIGSWLVTASHAGGTAIASVIALSSRT